MTSFVVGALSEKYICQPFTPTEGKISGIEYLEKHIPELEVTIEEQTVGLSQLLYNCAENQSITKAANLTDLVDKFVDSDTIFDKIDSQMSRINDTYDDIVADLDLNSHISALNGYSTPKELGDSKSELDNGKKEVEAILSSLETIQNNDAEHLAIKNKATKLAKKFEDLISEAQKLVIMAEQMKPTEIAPVLQDFSQQLTSSDSPIKSKIYDQGRVL